jgi:hypothetical protein
MLSQGVGKTMILQAFAEMLGYRRMTVFCFKERITIRKTREPTSKGGHSSANKEVD